MLVNCRVKECRGIVGFIVVGVDNTVGCFFGGVCRKYGEDVVALFNSESIFSALFEFEGRVIEVVDLFVSRH